MQISISYNYCIKWRRIVQTDLIFCFAFVAHPLCNVFVFKSNQLAVESYRRSVNYFCLFSIDKLSKLLNLKNVILESFKVRFHYDYDYDNFDSYKYYCSQP